MSPANIVTIPNNRNKNYGHKFTCVFSLFFSFKLLNADIPQAKLPTTVPPTTTTTTSSPTTVVQKNEIMIGKHKKLICAKALRIYRRIYAFYFYHIIAACYLLFAIYFIQKLCFLFFCLHETIFGFCRQLFY